MPETLLKIEDLSLGYPSKTIFHSLEWEVQKGEFWSILGPNGSGKTTLLKALGGWLKPLTGSVVFKGRNINEISQKEIAKSIGIVLSEEGINGFTVFENVLMGRYPWLSQFNNAQQKDYKIVEEVLQDVNLWEKRNQKIGELSQGERQRVWIARALAQEPEILILDEPTAHLDIKNQSNIFNLLEQIRLEKGLTIIAILHNMELAAAFSSNLVLIKAGEMIAKGKKQDVLTVNNLSQLYGVPVKSILNESEERYFRVCYRELHENGGE